MIRKLEPKNSVMPQKRRPTFLLLLFLLLLLPAAPSAAESPDWAVSVGLFDIGQSEKATEAGVEIRLAPRRLWRFDLVPTFAVTANEDGAFWGTAGFRWDVALGEKWVLTPNFGTVLYEQGDSKDLGHVIEFRSGIEIARRLAKGRLGVCLYHLSNASISSHNPGSESLVLVWSSGR
jgi:lipid A 3-O-deacylase